MSGALNKKRFSFNQRFIAILATSCIATTSLAMVTPVFAQQKQEDETTKKKKQTQKKKTSQDEKAATEAASTDNDGTLLKQVVISATGFEQNVKDAPASISVVTRDEIEKGSFHDLTDALRQVQGVAVTGTSSAQDIYMRGLSGSYTLILVDGKRQSTRDARTNGNAGFEQSFIPPSSAIDRIEVVRGPMSSLYGSDAMGGVINIITRKIPEKWTGSLTVDGTANQYSEYGNSAQASYYVGGPIVSNVMGLQLWGRGLGRQEDDMVSGTPKQKDFDLTGKLTVTPNENHDFIFEAGRARLNRYGNVGKTIDSTPSRGSIPVDTKNSNDRDHWNIAYTGRFDWTTADFSIMQEVGKRTNYTYNTAKNQYVANLRSPAIRNTVIDGKFTTPFELYGNHTLVTGGQYNKGVLTDQNPGLQTGLDQKFSIEQWAGFAEDEWWLNDDFSLTGGLRMDHHEIYGSHWSPRAYAVWHTTQNLTLKGGVSTGFRAPEIRTIAPGYGYTTGGRNCTYGQCGVIIGGSGLRPEKSTSYEVSALWDNLDNLQLGATYFYTDFKDKIVDRQAYDKDGNPIFWSVNPYYVIYESLNIDNAVLQGTELTALWGVTDSVSIRSNYTYTHSEQKTGDYSGMPLARTPKHMANIRADWMTPIEKLEAWTSANYHGKEVNAGFRSGSTGKALYKNGVIVGREYKDYLTLDIGASYNFNENVRLNGAIYNIFNKRVGVDEYNNVVEGRRLWLSMTTQF